MKTPLNSRPEASPFTIPVRVYYEDTDAAGVVYYANYLKFLERCRTEWIRALGYDQAQLARNHGIAFVVKHASTDYHQPACLDDALQISARILKLGRAQIIFEQHVHREHDQTLLVTATVQIVCVRTDSMKTTPIPTWLRQKLESLQ